MHKDYPKLEPGKAVWLPLDLADLDSVVKAAETFMSREAKLDILGTSLQPWDQTGRVTVDELTREDSE